MAFICSDWFPLTSSVPSSVWYTRKHSKSFHNCAAVIDHGLLILTCCNRRLRQRLNGIAHTTNSSTAEQLFHCQHFFSLFSASCLHFVGNHHFKYKGVVTSDPNNKPSFKCTRMLECHALWH